MPCLLTRASSLQRYTDDQDTITRSPSRVAPSRAARQCSTPDFLIYERYAEVRKKIVDFVDAARDGALDGEKGGTILRALLVRLVKPTAEVRAGLAAAGVEIKDTSGKMVSFTEIIRRLDLGTRGMTKSQRLATLSQVAGLRAVSGLSALVNRGADELEHFRKGLDEAGGAAKRLAELYIQYLAQRSSTRFCAVRFGNVLGSAGSVVLTWMAQLAKGGPITVTHRDMTRYFMTIREGAGLVMQSAAMAAGSDRGCGQLYMLDMGQPIRIVDLAKRFMRSQGFEPDVDVSIEFTGIRPGEKLSEQLAYDHEDALSTDHDSIYRLRTEPPTEQLFKLLIDTFDQLKDRVAKHGQDPSVIDRPRLIKALKSIIPELLIQDEPALPSISFNDKSLRDAD